MALMFRTKICGIRNSAEAEVVLSSGVDAVGLNFYESSSRFIRQEEREATVATINDRATKVGLFVNARPELVRTLAAVCELNVIQLHGDESVEFIGELSELSVLKAVRCQTLDQQLIDHLCELSEIPNVIAVLLDAYKEGEYGGTGTCLSWQELPSIIDAVSVPVVLAGGLTPGNVSEAIEQTRAYAVDVASGVEGHDGKKALEQCQTFVEQARNAFAHLA